MASKRFRRFINTHLAILSRIAWEGYQVEGRGLVRLSAGEVEEPDDGEPSGVYTTEESGSEDGTWDPGMGRLVANYDPETEFVCAILEPGAGVADVALVSHPLALEGDL